MTATVGLESCALVVQPPAIPLCNDGMLTHVIV